ncbi:MAG: GNAT family N-acetyltransferase [Bacillota bacterium]
MSPIRDTPHGDEIIVVVVRECRPDDAKDIADLLNDLMAVAHGDRPVTTARVESYFRHCAAHGEMYANFVAEESGRAVGFLSAVFYQTPFHDKGTCLINELIVDADYRGLGVGRALVESARDEAKRRAMDEIEVGTEKDNLDAQGFYKHIGFDEEFVLLGEDFHRGKK